MYKNYLKRFFDIAFSTIFILLSIPIFVIASILIVIDSNGPVFFRQYRVGMNLKPFVILKFRTMTNEPRQVGSTPIIGRVEGVTSIGYWLRRFKIDELPQLFNVFMGDMSLVGPRPSISKHLDSMTDLEKRRYLIRPGLTGYAQVSGNIHLSWKQRFEHDLRYAENITFNNDIRILIRTIRIVLEGERKFLNASTQLLKTSSKDVSYR